MNGLATEAHYQTEAYEEGYNFGKEEGFNDGLLWAIDKLNHSTLTLTAVSQGQKQRQITEAKDTT